MKYGLNDDGRRCGPINPLKVGDAGWTWYDTRDEMQAAARDREAQRMPSLEEARALKRAAVDREYAACLDRGVAYGGTHWDAGDEARLTLMELIEAAEALVAPVTILDRDDVAHELTWTQLQDLMAAGVVYRAAARERRLALHAEARAAADIAALNRIDETIGWPG